MAAVTAMTPFLVPLTAAALIVAVCTRVLIRRDRRCARAYTGGPGGSAGPGYPGKAGKAGNPGSPRGRRGPGGVRQDGCAARSGRSAPPRSR